MLSNAYFLAKFGFDTAENEPAKNLQNFAKSANFADPKPSRDAQVPQEEGSSLYSVFAAAVPAVEVVVKRSRDVLEELGLARIDLLHVNCEGSSWASIDC